MVAYTGTHMMLIERWAVAAIVAFGLVSTAGAPGQSPAGQTQQRQDTQGSQEADPPADPNMPDQPALPPDPDDPAQKPAQKAVESPAQNPVQNPAQGGQAAPAPDSAPAADTAPPAQPPAKPPKPAVPAPVLTPQQQQLAKDSAELLQLVQELKVEVEKAGSNTLSLEALRKADAVQKLAKSLKERMKEQEQVTVNKPG